MGRMGGEAKHYAQLGRSSELTFGGRGDGRNITKTAEQAFRHFRILRA